MADGAAKYLLPKLMGAGCALFMLTGGAVAKGHDYPGSGQDELKSANSNLETSLRFLNAAGFPVSIYWIDFDGMLQKYAELQDGEGYSVDTHVTHPWVVEDRAGVCQGVFFPERQPRTITIDSVE